jgi:hypothetical protein
MPRRGLSGTCSVGEQGSVHVDGRSARIGNERTGTIYPSPITADAVRVALKRVSLVRTHGPSICSDRDASNVDSRSVSDVDRPGFSTAGGVR